MRLFPLLAACSVFLLSADSARAEPPIGVWQINANGHEGDLVLNSVDDDGTIEGSLLGDSIRGCYDEATKCLSLLRVDASGGTLQAYKGYLFLNREENNTRFTIAGTFQVFAGEGESGVEYGWYAQVSRAGE